MVDSNVLGIEPKTWMKVINLYYDNCVVVWTVWCVRCDSCVRLKYNILCNRSGSVKTFCKLLGGMVD